MSRVNMGLVVIKHMLADYEKWKRAFEVLSSHREGLKILSYSTEMDKTNPNILITQIQTSDHRNLIGSRELIDKIFEGEGLMQRYELQLLF